jgi:hypothetical protein
MSLRAKRSNLVLVHKSPRDRFVAPLLAMTGYLMIASVIVVTLSQLATQAAEPQHCVAAEIVLWGDGRHDDSAALNAWFHGADAVWAENGEPVGESIAGHSFRLSAAVYVTGGTGRRLDDFRLLWPERGETVAGGTIRSGTDLDAAPVISGISITGGDPGEGIPFEAPDPAPAGRDKEASCGIS